MKLQQLGLREAESEEIRKQENVEISGDDNQENVVARNSQQGMGDEQESEDDEDAKKKEEFLKKKEKFFRMVGKKIEKERKKNKEPRYKEQDLNDSKGHYLRNKKVRREGFKQRNKEERQSSQTVQISAFFSGSQQQQQPGYTGLSTMLQRTALGHQTGDGHHSIRPFIIGPDQEDSSESEQQPVQIQQQQQQQKPNLFGISPFFGGSGK